MSATPDVPQQSKFSIGFFTNTRRRFFATVVLILLVGGLAGYYASQISFPQVIRPALAQGTRDYTLVVQQKDIAVAPGSDKVMGTSDDTVWHAWTYNGTVPGPTLKGKVGEILRVTLINNLNLNHSLHTHLAPYSFENDGSQANVLTGIGAGSMVSPGRSYTYQFQLTEAGLFYYHCHSSDGGYMINQHMLQGLYGAVVVDKPDAPVVRDNTIFMAEIGFNIAGTGAPTFIMNGLGIPGGETTLEQTFSTSGLTGVVDQFNKTVPAFKANVGETIRLHIVNIGNFYHSFHLHGTNMVSQWYFPGRIWPANVVQLVPGAADSVIIQPQYAGVWLFHCHVVSHADAGMIGVFQVV